MADYVVTQTYKLDDQISAGAKAVTDSLGQLADASDKAEAATDQLEKTTSRVGPSFDTVNRRIDENAKLTASLEAINRRYQQSLAAVRAEADAGLITSDQLAEKESRLGVLRDNQTQAARRQADAMAQMFAQATQGADAAVASQTRLNAALDAQNRINEQLVKPTTSADDYAKRQADLDAYGKSLDDLRAKYDPLFAVTRAYQTEIDGVAQAERTGAIDAATATAARDRLTKAFQQSTDALKNHGASAGNLAFAQRQLTVQSTQFFSSIASGQPILTAFLQQGHGMLDVMESTGVGFTSMAQLAGQSFAKIGGIIANNPVTVALVALAAVAVAFGVAAESSAHHMEDLQNTLRAVSKDYVNLAADADRAARQVAATAAVSSSDAQAAAKILASASAFSGIQVNLEDLITTSADLAKVMGVSVADAAKEMAKALKDPAAEAQALADQHLPGMSQALAYSIKLQAQAGDAAGAFGRTLAVIKDNTAGATKNVTPLDEAVEHLKEAFTGAGGTGTSFADVVGSAINGVAALGIELIAKLMAALNAAVSWINQHFPSTQAVTAAQLAANANRNVTTNPDTGALGFGQVLPDSYFHPELQATATYDPTRSRTLGKQVFNITDPNQNIDAMTRILNDALDTAHGDQSKALAIYGGFKTKDPSAYISGVLAQDPSKLSQDIQDAIIAKATALATEHGQTDLYGNPQIDSKRLDALTYLLPRLGLQESGGQHFAPAGTGTAVSTGSPAPLPPIPPQFGANQQLVDQAFKTYLGSGVLSISQADNQTKQDALTSAIGFAKNAGDTDTVNKLTEALAKLKGAATDLIPEQEKMARSATDNTAALHVEAGFARDMADIDTKYTLIARGLGVAVDEKSKALEKAAKATQLATNFNDQVDATNRLTDAQLRINAAYDGTAESVSHAQNVETARAQAVKDFPKDSDAQTDAINRYTAALDRGSAANKQFQQEQASVSALSSAFQQAFSTIGNAITQAFVGGQGAAVNWGNVMKAVITQVIQKMAELAIINPLLNSLFGQNNGTLGTALNVLSRSGNGPVTVGAQDSNGNPVNLLLNGASTISSVSGAAGGPTIFSSLGITGEHGLLSSLGSGLGLTGNGGVFSGIGTSITNFLNLPTGIGATGIGGIPLEGATSAAQVAASGTAGATVGEVLGPVGVGFGAGSFVGGLLQGAQNKTGPAPTIGAAAGALAGIALIPVLGPFGPILGGVAGGALGSLIGPHPKSPFTSAQVTETPQGTLDIGRVDAQLIDNQQEVAQLRSDITTLNNFMTGLGIKVTNPRPAASGFGDAGTLFQVGENTPGQTPDPTKVSDLNAAINRLQFTSSDPLLNQKVLSGKTFADSTALENAVTAFQQAQAAVVTFLTQTEPPLTNFAHHIGSAVDAVNQINATYQAQIDAAKQLAANENLSTDQVNQLTQAETDLAVSRDQAIKAANDAAADATNQTDIGLNSRYFTALASITGSTTDALNAQLYAFDTNADQQRKQLHDSMVATMGDTIVTTSAYNDQIALLERTLGEERLAIVTASNKQLTDAAQQSANTTVTNLTTFLQGLQTGAASPLAPQAQYDLASSQFTNVAKLADAGDFTSIGQLSNSATAFLNASRIVNGSGIGYTRDFNQVIDAVSGVASMSADMLTASAFTAETRTASQAQVAAIDAVRDEITALRAEIKQQASKPAQLAA